MENKYIRKEEILLPPNHLFIVVSAFINIISEKKNISQDQEL